MVLAAAWSAPVSAQQAANSEGARQSEHQSERQSERQSEHQSEPAKYLVFGFAQGDDQVTVEVRDGEAKVLLNGKPMDEDRYQRHGASIWIRGDDGRWAAALTLHNGGGTLNTQVPRGAPPRMRLGVSLVQPSSALAEHLGIDRDKSLSIAHVTEGGPAERAGLQVHDIIVGVDGDSVVTRAGLDTLLQAKAPGDVVRLTILRRGTREEVEVEPERVASDPWQLQWYTGWSQGPWSGQWLYSPKTSLFGEPSKKGEWRENGDADGEDGGEGGDDQVRDDLFSRNGWWWPSPSVPFGFAEPGASGPTGWVDPRSWVNPLAYQHLYGLDVTPSPVQAGPRTAAEQYWFLQNKNDAYSLWGAGAGAGAAAERQAQRQEDGAEPSEPSGEESSQGQGGEAVAAQLERLEQRLAELERLLKRLERLERGGGAGR